MNVKNTKCDDGSDGEYRFPLKLASDRKRTHAFGEDNACSGIHTYIYIYVYTRVCLLPSEMFSLLSFCRCFCCFIFRLLLDFVVAVFCSCSTIIQFATFVLAQHQQQKLTTTKTKSNKQRKNDYAIILIYVLQYAVDVLLAS